ncbi:MAG TPA: hypothetical protein VHF26_26455 [Trebonia sp.]|nr:hypothetical protein [Trebonia sp.]
MRLRLIALGCALTGTLGLLVLPSAASAGTTGRQAPSKAPTALSITSRATAYRYGDIVRLTVKLGPASADRAVSVYATPAGEPRMLIETGRVSAAGTLDPEYRLTRTTTFTAVFRGDGRHAPATATRTVRTAASVAVRVAGYFRQTRIGRLPYYVFRASGTLTLHATVRPAKPGECLEPETQQYDHGIGWTSDTRYGCDALDAVGHDTAPFTLTQAAGAKFRIRADYVHSRADTANLSADSQWLYLTVVK